MHVTRQMVHAALAVDRGEVGGCLVNHQHTWHTMNRPKVVQGTIKKKDNKTNRTTQTIDDNQKDEKKQKDVQSTKISKTLYAGNRCRKTTE
jgi:hypothetical protein